ncbi:MAG: ATP-binding protein [Acidimicrobiia bacterium]
MTQAETITFLFTDIEGSTRLLQRLGDDYPRVLKDHLDLLRGAVKAEGGRAFGSEGDAIFAGFSSARGAVAAAASAQRALAEHPWPDGVAVRVRMGLHTGEATASSEGYVGLDVHRAARITSAGHGGQVLVSEATRQLIESALPDGLALRDLGEHRLKDLARPERIHQLIVPGLPADFPPLKSLDTVPNNLPTQLTSFVGREREMEEALELLGEARMLTFTGPGGTGKTRLSLQVTALAVDDFPDGVFFVPLAPVRDPELVASTILQALGVQEVGAVPPKDRLLEYLREQRLLLLLDNFEQVVEAAPVIGEILRAAPLVKVLATSRAVLGVYGEQEYPVPPLGVPDPRHLPPLGPLSMYEAVSLFIQRALSAKPGFSVTNENAPAVAEITARLDGLPLAIELAAARIRVLSPQAILDRLGSRLTLLTGGARDLPQRQQTLRDAIAWSYDLLDEAGQRLFGRLSVFVGGFTLEEAEKVCGPAEELGSEVFDGVAMLADQSLVRQEDHLGEARFLMLETIREFALEKLAESDEEGEIRRRHAQAFLELAERAQPELTGKAQAYWLDRLEREHDNFRAAIAWATETGAAEIALRMGAALWRFWQMRGHLLEGRERAEQALKLPGAARPNPARAAGLEAVGGLAYWQGDIEAARGSYQEALDIQRELDDQAGIANALYNLSFTVGSLAGLDPKNTRPLLEESLAIFRQLEDRAGIARVLWALGDYFTYGEPDYELGRRYFEEGLEIFRELEDQFHIGWSIFELGYTALVTEDHRAARAYLEESLPLFLESGDTSGVVLHLYALAVLAKQEEQSERGLRLAGAAAGLGESIGSRLYQRIDQMVGRFGQLEPSAEDEKATRLWQEGRGMSLEEAVAYARGRS